MAAAGGGVNLSLSPFPLAQARVSQVKGGQLKAKCICSSGNGVLPSPEDLQENCFQCKTGTIRTCSWLSSVK